jgi:formylglycine-generating enzyme required for sulfatase activity
MHGNVCEWRLDYYGEDLLYMHEQDPQGLASGGERVFRGGPWRLNGVYSRTARRNSRGATFYSFEVGFRLVRELD